MTYGDLYSTVDYFNYKDYKLKYARDVTEDPRELEIKSIDIETGSIILKDKEITNNE